MFLSEDQILVFLISLGLGFSGLNFFYRSFLLNLKSSFVLRLNFFAQGLISVGTTCLLISRALRLDRAPWSNFYESLLILATLAHLVYWVLSLNSKSRLKLIYFSKAYFLIFTLICLYAFFMPGEQKDPLPLVPSLKSYWIIIHVPLVVFSYVFFLFSGFFAFCFLLLKKGAKSPKSQRKTKVFFELLIDFIRFGFLFLTLGLITGALWANQSWGSLWQWDPKENLALATWFAYLIILHFSTRRAVSREKIALFSLFGFFCFLLTYLGINYLELGGLHSYGEIK